MKIQFKHFITAFALLFLTIPASANQYLEGLGINFPEYYEGNMQPHCKALVDMALEVTYKSKAKFDEAKYTQGLQELARNENSCIETVMQLQSEGELNIEKKYPSDLSIFFADMEHHVDWKVIPIRVEMVDGVVIDIDQDW